MKRMPVLLGTVGLAAGLATVSCTTIGTHVKGGFACHAPQGTCAPMSRIDAEAIVALGTDAAAPTSMAGDEAQSPARFVDASGEGIPVRTGERVLRVVFPAHSDARGVFHEEAVAHVVSEHPGWIIAPAGPAPSGSIDASVQSGPASPTSSSLAPTASSGPNDGAQPLNLREAAAGLTAPALDPPTPSEHVATDTGGIDADAPNAAALAAARAGHRIGEPRPPLVPSYLAVSHPAHHRRRHRLLAHGRRPDVPGVTARPTHADATPSGQLAAASPLTAKPEQHP